MVVVVVVVAFVAIGYSRAAVVIADVVDVLAAAAVLTDVVDLSAAAAVLVDVIGVVVVSEWRARLGEH